MCEPVQANKAALGYDLRSEAVRSRALDTAMSLGVAAATGRIALVQLPGYYSTIIFQPIYQSADGLKSTTRVSNATISGFTYCLFVYSQILSKALENIQLPAMVDVVLFDIDSPVGKQYLGHYCSPKANGERKQGHRYCHDART